MTKKKSWTAMNAFGRSRRYQRITNNLWDPPPSSYIYFLYMPYFCLCADKFNEACRKQNRRSQGRKRGNMKEHEKSTDPTKIYSDRFGYNSLIRTFSIFFFSQALLISFFFGSYCYMLFFFSLTLLSDI